MEFLQTVVNSALLLLLLAVLIRPYYLKILDDERIEKSTPTLAQYIEKYPACKTERGIKCRVCNSMSIRNRGRDNAEDPRRLFKCNHCNTTLYRTEDW